jgi:hypothetical protein
VATVRIHRIDLIETTISKDFNTIHDGGHH